jgi:hypothetical protein
VTVGDSLPVGEVEALNDAIVEQMYPAGLASS